MVAVPQYERFAKIVGRWKTEGEILGAENRRIHGTDTYEWLQDGYFVIHWIDVMMGEEHVREVEIIGPFDPGSATFPMRTFGAGGSYAEMTGKFDEDGAILAEDKQSRTRLVVSEDRSGMEAHWERRGDDDDEWTPWLDVTFKKEV